MNKSSALIAAAAILVLSSSALTWDDIVITDTRITPDDKFEMTWDSRVGYKYIIYYSDDLVNWIKEGVVDSGGATTTWQKPLSQVPDKRMFKVRVKRFDLNTCFIKRIPEIDYVWGSLDPAVEGWPTVGQTVTWRAYVKSWADFDLFDVPYAWYIDGVKVEEGVMDLPSRVYTTIDMDWTWTFDRHTVKFHIDHTDDVDERFNQNNRVVVYTDAITVGFYVEQSVYDYFWQYQRDLDVGANSWDDWAQRHVKRWNQMFEDAVYGTDAPQGALDRIRLDEVHIVADGALPLAGGLPSNRPNANDRTIDLQWGFAATILNGSMYTNHTSATDNNPFYFEGSLMHELGHARYLLDTYGFNVHDNGSGNTVAIKENGEFIVGTAYMPFIAWDALHYTDQGGLMSGGYTYLSRYDAMCMNLIAGHRAWKGNYNAPQNIGVFRNDLPDENRLTVKDAGGLALPFADLKIYESESGSGWYAKHYDDTPDMELTTDAVGRVFLGRCPFDSDGTIEHGYGRANGVIIIRVEHGGKVGYGFLESTGFNMHYWRGNTTMGTYEINVNLIE